MFALVFRGASCRWVRIWTGLELSDDGTLSTNGLLRNSAVSYGLLRRFAV